LTPSKTPTLTPSKTISVISGNVYYVKNTGNDSNSGLSDALAWQTINKINNHNFVAGDQILFNRGDVWREQLRFQSVNGTSSSRITIGAYGSGNKPKLLGSVNGDVNGYWTSLGSNKWASPSNSFSSESFILFYDTNLATSKASINKTSSSALTANWDMWYDPVGRRVVVYQSNGSPDTQANGIEIAGIFNITTQGSVLTINWCNYITIDNIDVRYSNESGYNMWGENIGNGTCTYITYSNCELHYTWDKGYNLVYGDNILLDHCIADHCGYIGYNPTEAETVYSWGESVWVQLITNPTVRYTEIAYPHNNGIDIWGCSNALVENCYCHDVDTVAGEYAAFGGLYESGVYIDGTDNVTIRYNNIKNLPIGIAIGAETPSYTSNNILCYYNIAINNDQNYDVNCTQAVSNIVTNLKFYNNISYNDVNQLYKRSNWSGFWIQYCTTVDFKNNIIYNKLSGANYLWRIYATALSVTSDYNDFYLTTASQSYQFGNNYYGALTAYKTGSGQESHSISTDPLFASSTDYHLQSNSLAINAGVHISTPVILTDYDGITIGNPPEIGVYEY
jgi:hypothetical protein